MKIDFYQKINKYEKRYFILIWIFILFLTILDLICIHRHFYKLVFKLS